MPYESVVSAVTSVTDEADNIERCWGVETTRFMPSNAFLDAMVGVNVDSLIGSGMLRTPYLTVKLAGRDVPVDSYTETRKIGQMRLNGYIIEQTLRDLLGQGATILFNYVDQWKIAVGERCTDLKQHLQSSGGATLFYTPSGHRGLEPHRDASHVFAIQLTGCKNWLVEHAAPVGGDWDDSVEKDVVDRLEPFKLAEGDGLYMPPGVAHVAFSDEEPSLHLSIWISEPRVSDLLYIAAVKVGSSYPVNSFAPPPGADRVRWAEQCLSDCSRRLSQLDTEDVITQLATRIQRSQ